MSKTSVLRSILAAFLIGLGVTGCGGGGDDIDSQGVPAGAKVCELREVSPNASIHERKYVTRAQLRMDRTVNADGSFSIRAVDGNIGDVYAQVHSSAQASTSREGIVNSELRLAGHERYSVYMYTWYGTSQGVSVIGAPYDYMLFGAETGQPFQESDIQGLTSVPGISFLLVPQMAIGDDYVFTVGIPIPYSPPWHPAQRFTLYVQEYLHPRAAGHVPYWSCEVTDLQSMEQVQLVGGQKEQQEYYVELRATVPLDDGRFAASEPIYFFIMY